MELILPDTDKTLPSGSASASRCTYTFGNALILASEKLKGRILERAGDLLMTENPSDLAMAPGMVRHLPSGKEIPLSKMALYMNESERSAVARFKAPVAPERFDVGEGLNLHGFPHTLFSFGACMAMVEVDELTGEVSVCHYLSSTDCGKIINPDLYEQQIQGAIAQGIGYALMEDLKVEQGAICSKNFETYIIPTSMDIPDIESIPVEIFEETGPYGLKGLGEIATNGPAAAIANAIHDACGVRTMETPMKPESLLLAMRERNQPGSGN
jgi:CO/xanthine dehydrogenase Mo-binding subunit